MSQLYTDHRQTSRFPLLVPRNTRCHDGVKQLVAESSDLVADYGSDQPQSLHRQVELLIRGGLGEDFPELGKYLLENSPEFLTVKWMSA